MGTRRDKRGRAFLLQIFSLPSKSPSDILKNVHQSLSTLTQCLLEETFKVPFDKKQTNKGPSRSRLVSAKNVKSTLNRSFLTS